MTSLLILALLAADPVDAGIDLGANDVPVLLHLDGSRQTLTGVEPLPLGTVCLDHPKAASVRDDLAAKNARVASLEASLGTNWPVVVIVAAAGVVAAGAAAAAGYCAGDATHCGTKKP